MFVPITMVSLLLSLSAFLIIGALPRKGARRVAASTLVISVPTLITSLAVWTAEGERGLLSNAEAVAVGSLFMLLSVGLGYFISWLRQILSGVRLRSSRGGKIKPDRRDDLLA
jgi:hypothetical protein